MERKNVVPSLPDALNRVLRDYTGIELGRLGGYADGSAISKFVSGVGELSLARFHRISFRLSVQHDDNRLADAFSAPEYRNQRVLSNGARRAIETNFLEILEAGGNLRSKFSDAPTYVLLTLIDRMRAALFDLEGEIRDRERCAA